MHQQEAITLFQWMLDWLLVFIALTAYDEASHMAPKIMLRYAWNKYGGLIVLVLLGIFLLGMSEMIEYTHPDYHNIIQNSRTYDTEYFNKKGEVTSFMTVAIIGNKFVVIYYRTTVEELFNE